MIVLKRYWQFLVGLAMGLVAIFLFKKSPIEKLDETRREDMKKLEDDINSLKSAKREIEKRETHFDENRSDEDIKKYWDKE